MLSLLCKYNAYCVSRKRYCDSLRFVQSRISRGIEISAKTVQLSWQLHESTLSWQR